MAFLCSEAAAQCCSAGNPYFYNEQGALDSRELYLSAGYKNSISDRYYTASDKIYIGDIDKAWFNYLNLQAMYGLTKRVSLHADMGYFINKSEKYLKPDWLPKRGYGIGDLTLTMKYQAYNNQAAKFSVTPSVGIKLPVGVFDQEINKVKLPITLQPSSGSFRYNTNLFLEKGFSDPAYRRYNGIQLGNNVAFSVRISHLINLKRSSIM